MADERDAGFAALSDELARELECFLDEVWLGDASAVEGAQAHALQAMPLDEAVLFSQRELLDYDAAMPGAATAGAAPAAAPKTLAASEASLEELLENLDASFSETLLALIDARGLSDAEVYKRAHLSRQHFSKIRSDVAYRPKKATVLSLAIALRLTLEETELLLGRAGYSLSHASKADVIVEYFITRGIFDLDTVNSALYRFDQALLAV